jgi:RHS repeat-associated protein
VEERAYAVLPEGVTPLADRVRRGDSDEVRYYVEAPNGMPAALVGGDGRLLGELEASLFGKVDGEQAGVTPVRFPGQYADEETGLYYNRYRYYDPETGQYLSPEPIRLEGSLYAYAYVDGSPVDLIDADGLAKMWSKTKGASGVTAQNKSGGFDLSGQPRSRGDLHPAVQAALPPSAARADGQDPSTCSEPWALTDHGSRRLANPASQVIRTGKPIWAMLWRTWKRAGAVRSPRVSRGWTARRVLTVPRQCPVCGRSQTEVFRQA